MIVKIVYATVMLDGLAFAMTLTTLGPYIYKIGGSHFFLGALGSISALINLIWNPIAGGLSDRFGRKFVLMICLTICLFSNLLMALFSSLWLIFIARTLSALGTPIMSLFRSLINDHIESNDERIALFNKMQAIGGVTFIIGPIFSGYLSEYDHGIKYIFFIITMIFLINLILIGLLSSSKNREKSDGEKSFRILDELKSVIDNLIRIEWTKYWDLFTIKLLIEFTLNIFQFSFGLILTETYSLSGRSFGYIFASMSIIGIVFNLLMIRLKSYLYNDDNDGLLRLLHCNFLLIFSYICFGLAPNFLIFISGLIPMSVARILADTTFNECILLRTTSIEIGSVMATFDNTISLAGLICPLLSGILTDQFGDSFTMILCSLPVTVGALIIYFKQQLQNKFKSK